MKANLEISVGCHRRLKGKGKSNPGDDVGVFEFRWRHNPYAPERRASCTVRRGQGWECLTILIYDRDSKNAWHQRSPTWREIERLLPLFFEAHERPVQFWKLGDRGREGMHLYLSDRSSQWLEAIPEFGDNFSLTKQQ